MIGLRSLFDRCVRIARSAPRPDRWTQRQTCGRRQQQADHREPRGREASADHRHSFFVLGKRTWVCGDVRVTGLVCTFVPLLPRSAFLRARWLQWHQGASSTATQHCTRFLHSCRTRYHASYVESDRSQVPIAVNQQCTLHLCSARATWPPTTVCGLHVSPCRRELHRKN